MRNAGSLLLLLTVAGFGLYAHGSTVAAPAFENPTFQGPQQPDGSLTGWFRRTRTSGYVKLMEDNGTHFVRIGTEKGGEDSMLAQVVAIPAGAVAISVTVCARYDVKPGKKSWCVGRYQGEFLDGAGKRIGDYAVIDMRGVQTEWRDVKRVFELPKDAKSAVVKLAVFFPQEASHVDFARVDGQWMTGKDLTAERGKFRPAQPFGDEVSAARFAKLARGVNLANWFIHPNNVTIHGQKGSYSPEYLHGYFGASDVARLKAAGFTHVRLPVEPAPFMDASGALTTDLLPELERTVRLVVDGGLAVIVDAHATYGNYKGMSQNPDLADAFVRWWDAFARHFAQTTDPEWVFLELMNEPGFEGYYGGKWSDYQDRLIMTVSAAAPRHTIVANGGGWLMVPETIQHEPHPYRNMVFAVHYYAPSPFTHQGAIWMSSWYHPLRNVPWPIDSSNLQGAVDAVAVNGKNAAVADHSRKALQDMVAQHLGTRAYQEDQLDQVAAWAKEKHRRVLFGEFGVYKEYCPPESRVAWLRAVREGCEKRGFGWNLWEYASVCGFATGEPEARTYDPAVLQALGLKADR